MTEDGDSRFQHGMDSAVIAKRAQHELVAIESIRLGSRSVAHRVVVVPDRRVVAALESDGLWKAYESIYEAIKIRTQGLGARAFDPSRVPGRSAGVENGAYLLLQYDAWHKLCKARHLSPRLVLDMVIDGLPLYKIDQKRRFMAGTAKKNLWKCLALWDEV